MGTTEATTSTPQAAGESTSIKGLTKAAILLLNLEGDVAAQVLKHLDEQVVEEITREGVVLTYHGQRFQLPRQ